jgi:hypothetical protein
VRNSVDAWATVVDLIVETLSRSPHLDEGQIRSELLATASIGPRLVAGGHLDSEPVVLMAENLHLSITITSGAEAFALEENLAAVPGGATATDWTVHLPTPTTLTDAILKAIEGCGHLTVAPAPTIVTKSAAVDLIDLEALARVGDQE